MPEYRRFRVEGGIYFFTVVTYHRRPILIEPIARKLLRNAWEDTQRRFPFETIAICLLPDHFHCIWKLPERDSNYAIRWKEIKYRFTVGYLKEIGPGEERNKSRQKRQEAAIWQRRYWEHTIDSEEDFENHFDYIHYNPLKHGLVKKAVDWEWSSFHRYVKEGIYDANWVGGDEGRLQGFEFD
ncbi:MAG: transposase [Chloroflexi bacterium HGW-Chloroflexi-5]|nr:MAG: transposase [Chloroflexi bacterium HGW-Chloroflexi-5]